MCVSVLPVIFRKPSFQSTVIRRKYFIRTLNVHRAHTRRIFICLAAHSATDKRHHPRRVFRAEPAVRLADSQDERNDFDTVLEQKLHIGNGGNRPRVFRPSVQR